MTTIYAFVYRRMDTVNGPQDIGQWDYIQVPTALLEALQRLSVYSPGYRVI